MPFTYNNKIIREGRGWTDDSGIKHPPTWASWSDAEKASKGLIWQDPPASYDNRFWWDADTPKDIDTLKSEGVAKVKEQAGSLLAASDWYVTRQAETNVRMPVKVLAYRDAVRDAASQIEAGLMAAADHSEFVATVTSITWPDPDAKMTPEEELAAEREAMVCSAFQARAALAAAGLLDQVDTAILSAEPAAKIAWEYAIEFRRLSPTIVGLASTLSLTDSQLDNLFRAAMQIEA